jgi:hypothetical protein
MVFATSTKLKGPATERESLDNSQPLEDHVSTKDLTRGAKADLKVGAT